MKNLFFFSLLAIILVGCDGGDPINPPVIVEKFTITGMINGSIGIGTINPFSQTVEKGKSATFTISPNYGYEIDYLLDDGNKLPAVNVYTVRDIIENDTFEVFFKKDSIVWPLINITWKLDTIFFKGKDDIVWYYTRQNFTDSFYPDGKIVNVYDGRTTVSKYYLDKSNLIIKVNTITYKIESLTEKRMVLSWMMGVEKTGHRIPMVDTKT